MEEIQKPQNMIKIGVTITESDVFETDDLPEDDQQLVSDYISSSLAKETHRSDCIDSSRLDATEAFKAFADKSLDSKCVDFSDSIAIARVGYPMTKTDRVKKETLEERYNRLEKAVKDLAQEIDIVKANEGDKGDGDKVLLSATSMMQKLNFLQRELSSVGVKEELIENDPQRFYHRKLLNDLDLFISSSSSSAPTAMSPAADGDVIRYQMLCSPGETLHADDAIIEDLEQRIERCENIIGLEADKSGSLSGETPNKTLMGALSMVVAKFALLDLTQLTHFESSLLAIQQKQIAASTKSEASDIADKVDRVAGLYELLKKWDSMANAIPHILDRLNISSVYEAVKKANPTMEKLVGVSERLKTLLEDHQSAAQFSLTLAHVDSSQKRMIDTLSTHTEHLKQIQALLGPQMGLFEANCKALEELAS